jgi:hypothetical protein
MNLPLVDNRGMRMRALSPLIVLLGAACIAEPMPAAATAPTPLQLVTGEPAPAPQGCREFNTPVTIGGQQQQAYGTACLQPDGSWKIDQQVAGQPMPTYVVPPQVYQPYYPPTYLNDPWLYGPPLFLGGIFIGGGWGYGHDDDGWRGAWNEHWRGPEHDGWHGPGHEGWHEGPRGGFHGRP